MNRDEIISVIIPTFNSGKFIAEAIKSVLQQTVPPQEIIVVDDGSTDETESVVMQFKDDVQYVYQEHAGVAAARNEGLGLSQGDLITFIDADDIWLNNKIELQLQLFEQNPETELVIGFLQRVYKDCNDKSAKIFAGDESGIFVLSLGCTLIREKVFEQVGNFDEELTMSEDFDWFLRTRELGIKAEVHCDTVQLYRQHESNTTKDKLETNRYFLKAFKKSLDRRRKQGLTDLKIPHSPNDIDEMSNFWNHND